MELRPWLLWVVAAAGALVLLAADARGQKVFTNTWAVRIPGGLAVADSVARKHGFLNLGQVGVLPSCWPRHRTSPGGGANEGRGSSTQSRNSGACLLRGIWVVGMLWVACPALGLLA